SCRAPPGATAAPPPGGIDIEIYLLTVFSTNPHRSDQQPSQGAAIEPPASEPPQRPTRPSGGCRGWSEALRGWGRGVSRRAWRWPDHGGEPAPPAAAPGRGAGGAPARAAAALGGVARARGPPAGAVPARVGRAPPAGAPPPAPARPPHRTPQARVRRSGAWTPHRTVRASRACVSP